MLDPLTALGLASNIVQLITFTSDLISKSREYYGSTQGALVEQLELEAITVSLQTLSKKLDAPISKRSTISDTERQLSELCNGCREVSEELLTTVQELRSEGTPTRWNSFRQALKSMWNEDKIKALEGRLDRYRRQIDTELLISLRESIGALAISERDSEQVSHVVFGTQKDVKQWQRDIVEAVHRDKWNIQNEADHKHFSAKLSACAREDANTLIKEHILERLRFSDMEERGERIPKAHEKTFDWIFRASEYSDRRLDPFPSSPGSKAATKDLRRSTPTQPQWSNFRHWLESESSLYWITGKAGCGKSTLMKYLQSELRTKEYLATWVHGKRSTVAGYFFWNSGTEMQISKLGLLQTLLYSAVEEKLDLVPVIFPRRWKSYQLFGGDLRDWSMGELLQAFQLLISDDSTKFLFFIDGLDEFDGDGLELVSFIRGSIGSRKNVKFCVASRPWLVFEDAFQRGPSLRLEDLTVLDIQLFVAEKLKESDMFIRLDNLEHSEASRLIAEVTEKASGVFLWVHLVVFSLLEGLRDGDTIADLQARLLLLPSDLEELFDKMLHGLNPAYFEQASMYFQIIRAAVKPPTLLILSFAEEGFEKVMAYPTRPETVEEQDFRAERMRRRLSSRCKGLLEAPITTVETSQAKVQYLHRTVRDYICRQKVWDFVTSGTSESFDPNVALSSSWLVAIKTMTPCLDELKHFWVCLRNCADYSIKFEKSRPDVNIALIDELSRVGDHIFETKGPKGNTLLEETNGQGSSVETSSPNRTKHWTCTESGYERGATCFLGYAVLYPLRTYVESKLQNKASLDMQVADHSLLYIASRRLDVQFVEVLFNLGADPNCCEKTEMGWTTWQFVLWGFVHGPPGPRKSSGQAADILQLFLENGADVTVIVGGLTVHDLIKNGFREEPPARKEELLRKVAAARKKNRKSIASPHKMQRTQWRIEQTRADKTPGTPTTEYAKNVDIFETLSPQERVKQITMDSSPGVSPASDANNQDTPQPPRTSTRWNTQSTHSSLVPMNMPAVQPQKVHSKRHSLGGIFMCFKTGR